MLYLTNILCFQINKNILNCDNNLKKEIKRELLKRLHKPLYIPVIVLLTSFLIIYSKSNEHYEKFNKIIFFIVFTIIIVSEISLRYSVHSIYATILYLITPLLLFLISYLSLIKLLKNA